MRVPVYSGQFKRDVKAAQKRGKDMAKLRLLITRRRALPATYLEHPLKGRWRSFRDAHIEPDWLLIYKVDGDAVRFERTGRHPDLFES